MITRRQSLGLFAAGTCLPGLAFASVPAGGTDHGTATAGFAIGGAVAGGRVVADWPGLSNAALYQGRDLAPTTDLRSFIKGLLGDHLGVTSAALEQKIFPDSATARPLHGLIRT